MSSRRLILATLVLLALVLVCAGCSRKVVRPDMPGPPGMAGPYGPGQLTEQSLQMVQAELKVIYFDYDQYALSPEAQAAAQYNADVLKRSPNGRIVAEGHCDERGTAEYNLALGDRRSRSVLEYLTGLGVDPRRLSIVSYGSELPVDPGHNEAAWAKNRRVYLRVSQ